MEKIRLAILDDEKPIINLIKALVPWDSLSIDIVGEACNGEDGLALVDETHPDIVITDIMMPGMNGLELISETHKRYADTEFIIISGYREFDYAQSAIRSGVENYLLKPIDRDELVSTLERLAMMIRNRKSVGERLRKSDEEEKTRELHRMVIEGGGDSGRCLIAIKIDSSSLFLTEEECRVIHDKIRMLLLKQKAIQAVTSEKDIALAAVEDSEDAYECAESVSCALRELSALFPRFTLSLFVVPRMGHMTFNDSYKAIIEALPLRYASKGVIVIDKPVTINIDKNLLDDWSTLSDRMLSSFSYTEIADALDSFEKRVDKGVPLSTMLKRAGKMFSAKAEAAGYDGASWYIDKYIPSISIAPDSDSLLIRFRFFIMSFLVRTLAEKEKEERRPIRDAIRYMNEHFMDPDFSLESVSAIAGFSPTYFSQIFRKETGKGFQDFIVDIKMQKAKEMLRDTSMPVYAIAEKIGYSDAKHFSRLFQKKAGVKPNEFRKLYG